VIQSSSFDFTIVIANGDKSYNLLFSIHPAYARTHLVSKRPKYIKRWHFADYLMKHIGDGEIESIEQVDLDRIIKIRIIPPADIIDQENKLLIGEFMGKHSNVILVEESGNRILESMKHVDETMSRYRQVMPGLEYIPPPSGQSIDPFSVDKEIFSEKLVMGKGPFWRRLLNNFQGMSPVLAKEIIARANEDSIDSIFSVFKNIMSDVKNNNFHPTVITADSDHSDVLAVSAIKLYQFQDSYAISFPDTSEALEFFYQRLIKKDSMIAEKASISQAIKKRLEVLEEKRSALEKDLEVADNAEDLRLKGELIISNIYKLQRGQKEVTLKNFYDPEAGEVSIELDEKLNPADNAQEYFDRYKKAKRSKDVIEGLIKKNVSEIRVMQKIMEEVDKAENLESLEKIRISLIRRGVMKAKHHKEQKYKEEPLPFRRFKSSEGFQILVGRNDKENDMLIKGESSKNDMWLHAKQIEGSHVIVRNPEKRPDIPKRTLLEAAIIASKFSKAKHSGIVPVDYTWIKYVNKPRGGKPGFVTYTHEKTLFVSPGDFDKLSTR
jgi:predicted ribosome quality control (RQC) complex YloA/Tae2 family protein